MSKGCCCVCFEEVGYRQLTYICQTCNSGIVCAKCLGKITKAKTVDNLLKLPVRCFRFMNLDTLKKSIRCPCCRTENWKHLYSEIITKIGIDILDKILDKKSDKINAAEKLYIEKFTNIVNEFEL